MYFKRCGYNIIKYSLLPICSILRDATEYFILQEAYGYGLSLFEIIETTEKNFK